jgi:hypothetical protein
MPSTPEQMDRLPDAPLRFGAIDDAAGQPLGASRRPAAERGFRGQTFAAPADSRLRSVRCRRDGRDIVVDGPIWRGRAAPENARTDFPAVVAPLPPEGRT